VLRPLAVEDTAIRKNDSIRRDLETIADDRRQDVTCALGRLNRRVAHHQGDTARIRTEIDRRQIGVTRDGAHVERIDTQHLRDQPDEHVV
jgi:hypothetical protein